MGVPIVRGRLPATPRKCNRTTQPAIAEQEQSPWLIALAQSELRQVPIREMLVILYIFFAPQLSYAARHPGDSVVGGDNALQSYAARKASCNTAENVKGTQAKIIPYALGPSDMHEYTLEFVEYWKHPAAFIPSKYNAPLLETHQTIGSFTLDHMNEIQHGANKGDAILIRFSHYSQIDAAQTSLNHYAVLAIVIDQVTHKPKSTPRDKIEKLILRSQA